MAILVPYDGSKPAQKALERAIEVADGEEIVLLRVVELADGMLDAGVDLLQERIKELRDEESVDLSAELTDLLESTDVAVRTETVAGKPAREIVAFAEDDEDVSHIVIGSHGRPGVSRVLLGSVAETVVRRAPTTVTVVR